jgi:hypothetical protein
MSALTGSIRPFAALAAATVVKPAATMCLTSALVYHGLSDAIPFTTDIALSRGTRHPAGFAHVSWHSFDASTFDVGRTEMPRNLREKGINSTDIGRCSASCGPPSTGIWRISA